MGDKRVLTEGLLPALHLRTEPGPPASIDDWTTASWAYLIPGFNTAFDGVASRAVATELFGAAAVAHLPHACHVLEALLRALLPEGAYAARLRFLRAGAEEADASKGERASSSTGRPVSGSSFPAASPALAIAPPPPGFVALPAPGLSLGRGALAGVPALHWTPEVLPPFRGATPTSISGATAAAIPLAAALSVLKSSRVTLMEVMGDEAGARSMLAARLHGAERGVLATADALRADPLHAPVLLAAAPGTPLHARLVEAATHTENGGRVHTTMGFSDRSA